VLYSLPFSIYKLCFGKVLTGCVKSCTYNPLNKGIQILTFAKEIADYVPIHFVYSRVQNATYCTAPVKYYVHFLKLKNYRVNVVEQKESGVMIKIV